jgi:hypothetical protein
MAPNTLTGLLALSALSSAAVPNQRRAAGAQTTQALPLPVEAPEGQALWASVITADASSTEYLVACQTAYTQPDSCDGPYTGVTVTKGPQTMGVAMGGKTYACDIREEDAICEVVQNNADNDATTETKTIARDQWAQVAIAAAEPTAIPNLEMRAPKSKGGGGSRKGGSGSKGSSDDCDSDDSDNENEECKKNAGARVRRAGVGVAVAAMGFAALM